MKRILLLAFAAACGTDDPPPDPVVTAHTQCVQELNRVRKGATRPAVGSSAALEDYADMGAMIDMSGKPGDHFAATAGGGIADAEVECPSESVQTTLADSAKSCIASILLKGPNDEEYQTMMSTYGTSGAGHVGCGIFEENGRALVLLDFGP
jgi:hypothetical protein